MHTRIQVTRPWSNRLPTGRVAPAPGPRLATGRRQTFNTQLTGAGWTTMVWGDPGQSVVAMGGFSGETTIHGGGPCELPRQRLKQTGPQKTHQPVSIGPCRPARPHNRFLRYI